MPAFLNQTTDLLLLIFGFGFVIFFHELGHFLAAKWAGVRVEQFAVGFGQALMSWRKGLGIRAGSSAKEYEQIVAAAKEGVQGRDVSQISETEYRLNWIPLGGYVKMLGQDDLNPNSASDDPRAYNRKSIGKRMVIVSAGVIMNVILAAIGFFVLFLIGFDVPPPVVGMVMPGSPAQKVGIHVGDRILKFDGKQQRDFTKIQLNVALVKQGEQVPIEIQHPDGSKETPYITPSRPEGEEGGFLALGVTASPELIGPDKKDLLPTDELAERKKLTVPDIFALNPGDVVVAINGQPVPALQPVSAQTSPDQPKSPGNYWYLDRAVQASEGKPVTLTIANGGSSRTVNVIPRFQTPFSGPLNFAGFAPRADVISIENYSEARGKLQAGDEIAAVTINTDTKRHPTCDGLRDMLLSAGDKGEKVSLTVVRDGKTIEIKDLGTVKLKEGKRGLGVQPDYDADSAVIGAVLPGSPADQAGISVVDSSDAAVTKLGDEPVTSFHDIRRILANAKPGKMPITIKSDAGEQVFQLPISQKDIEQAKDETYRVDTLFHALSQPRKTKNFLVAAGWGMEETRDLIVQFYITLQRMFGGSVSAKSMMGPLGIGKAGLSFAEKGMDWLIWFLAMISANLAVVNFLPIPIVDGGLFLFLIIEKFQGKPLSPKVQSIAQIVGIMLIASVFIFVTYQDIMRH